MGETKLEHEILLALTVKEIEDGIQNLGRDFGKHFKDREVDVKEFQLHVLGLVGEAYEILKEKARKEKEKEEKKQK